jgi:long-chain acyl-CoA synthetase
MGKINPKPVFRIQKVNNLSVIFSFLKDDLGIRLENMGPEDVCGGNVKMILGLVWTLISHFQFQGLNIKAQMSAKGAVLEWARLAAAPCGVEVNNLGGDWEDGKALCAIVHLLRPDLIDMDKVNRSTPMENVALGLSVLEQHCKVPHILDAQEIVSTPDEKSFITFLAEVMKVSPKLDPAPASGGDRGVLSLGRALASPSRAPRTQVVSPRPAPLLSPTAAGSRSRPASDTFVLPSAPANTVPALLFAAAKQFASQPAWTEESASSTWAEHTAQVCAAMHGMTAAGVKRGDRVVILGDAASGTRTVYLAVQCASAVPVCLYARDLTLLEIIYAVQCSGARVLTVTSAGLWEKISARVGELDKVKVVVFGPGVATGAPASGANVQLLSWKDFLQARSPSGPSTLDVRPQDAAAWVFTAGMTGAPKPVILTHQMLVEAGRAAQAHMALTPSDVIASHLSLANAQQQVLDVVVPCISGAQVVYCAPGVDFRSVCRTAVPTVIAALPLQWHSVIQDFTADNSGKDLTQLSSAQKKALVESVRLERCRWPLCVWAPISQATVLEFRTVGIPLYRTYGLAEACGLVSMEGPQAFSSDNLVNGKPLSSVQVKFGAKGEMLISGPSVFAEYATEKAVKQQDGFFSTGDCGSFQGSLLQMSGRLTDVFELQSGAVVYPVEAECALREHPFVSHAIVVGRGQTFAVAFLTLDRAVMEPVAKSRGVSVAQLASSPQVGTTIKTHVDRINAARSRDVRIRKFAILPAVHAAKGELTPTQCVRREEVVRHNRKASDALFSPDVTGDVDRLKKCAADSTPLVLFTGPSVGAEFKSLWDLQERVTYWTEDGNDLTRSGSSVVLSGQEVLTLTPAGAAVDDDELALVNMLYAGGPPVSIWPERKQTGREVRAVHAEDFQVGVTYYTQHDTSVVRCDEGMLVINDKRQIPLEILASEFGSEVGENDTPSPAFDEPPRPSTPGARRLADIRKNKEKEEAERRHKAEKKRLQRLQEEEEERAAMAALEQERERLEQEQARLAALEEETSRMRELELRAEQELEARRRSDAEGKAQRARDAEAAESERQRKEAEARAAEEQRRRANEEKIRRQAEEATATAAAAAAAEAAAEDERRQRERAEHEALQARREADERAAASPVEDPVPVFVVLGAETGVGRAALTAICRNKDAGDKFNVRAVFCGTEDTSFEQQTVMRELKTVSEAVSGDYGDLESMEDAMQGAARVLVVIDDEYRFTEEGRAEFGNGVVVFEVAKAKGVGTVVLLSRLVGGGASREFQAIENNMEALVGGSDCAIIRSSLTMEQLVGDLLVSDDGKGLHNPLGRGKLAPISVADLGAFCAEVVVRDGMGGSCVQVTGPSLVGAADFAEAMDLVVLEDNSNGSVSKQKRDEERSIAQGEMAFVFTENFENLLEREPTSFAVWSEEHLVTDEIRQRRAKAAEAEKQRKKKEEEQASALAMQRLSVSSANNNRKSTSSGWERTDISIMRAKNAARLGSKCRLCSSSFGVARWSAACSECDEVACRKCLHAFSSMLVKPSHPAVFGVPQQVCDKCLPDLVKHIEQVGNNSDATAVEVRSLGCVPSSEEVPALIGEQASVCSVCSRKFGRFRAPQECTCCSQPVCSTCYRLVTSDVLDFPAPANNVLCETCVPDLKNEIRGGGLESRLCEQEMCSLDLVTLGLRGPVMAVAFQADLSAAEQDAVIQGGKEKCHVCSSDFGFLLRPHRCGSCSRLVCSKDAANHVTSDLLVINDAWVCFMCFPYLIDELKTKKRDNPVLEDLVEPEITALTEVYTARRAPMKPAEVKPAEVAPLEKQLSPRPVAVVAAVSAGKEEATDSVEAVSADEAPKQVKTCVRCSQELSVLVVQATCSQCQEPACSKCCYHFRSTALGLPSSQWVCQRCVGYWSNKIVAAGKERPKLVGAAAAVEVFPPRCVQAGGIFSPLDEPEFHDFSAKDVKAIEGGKSKCYTCAAKHDVFSKPVRCGKCRKIACTRCTESFKSLGFTMKRNFGHVSVCKDCWPGVRLVIEHLAASVPSLEAELRSKIVFGDTWLSKSAPLRQHPLEAKFKAKTLVKQKCRECSRKASPLRGLGQCEQCDQIVCITCTGQFLVPDVKPQGLTRLCMTCTQKLQVQDRIKNLTRSDAAVPVQRLPAEQLELVAAHPKCKNCQKDFDFWRRPYVCFACDVPSCWQCATASYVSITQDDGKKGRLCTSCIPDVEKQLNEDEAFAEADKQRELEFLQKERTKIEAHDRDQFVVEQLAEDDGAPKKASFSGAAGPGGGEKPAPMEKRPSFLHRTFSRKIKDSSSGSVPMAAAAAGCTVCAKPFGLTRKQKQCAECSLSVCGACSSEFLLASLKWPAKRLVCDKCVAPLRVRVAELQDNPYDHQSATADLKLLEQRQPVGVQKKVATADEVAAAASATVSPRNENSNSVSPRLSTEKPPSCADCGEPLEKAGAECGKCEQENVRDKSVRISKPMMTAVSSPRPEGLNDCVVGLVLLV